MSGNEVKQNPPHLANAGRQSRPLLGRARSDLALLRDDLNNRSTNRATVTYIVDTLSAAIDKADTEKQDEELKAHYEDFEGVISSLWWVRGVRRILNATTSGMADGLVTWRRRPVPMPQAQPPAEPPLAIRPEHEEKKQRQPAPQASAQVDLEMTPVLKQAVEVSEGKKPKDFEAILHQVIQEKNDHLRKVEKEKDKITEGLKRSAHQLKQSVREKEQTIAGLQQTIQEKNQMIAELRASLRGKDQRIAALEKDLEYYKRKEGNRSASPGPRSGFFTHTPS